MHVCRLVATGTKGCMAIYSTMQILITLIELMNFKIFFTDFTFNSFLKKVITITPTVFFLVKIPSHPYAHKKFQSISTFLLKVIEF